VEVNDRLQTDNPNVYAAGDALGCWQFTHMATMEGKHAAMNALVGRDEPMDYSSAGWATFTDPELASVGINAAQAEQRGLDYEVYRIDPNLPDRARIEGNPDGQVKVVAEPGGGRIFGAQILAARAGEIIQEFVSAISHDIPFSALADSVHLYPTLLIGHYEAGQFDWEQLAEQPGRLEDIRRTRGFAGRDDS
jgi:pyruvate/2-oxoglutarate dehydrogenase complex dihydrolipoamide dehydrogenase (E3) component